MAIGTRRIVRILCIFTRKILNSVEERAKQAVYAKLYETLGMNNLGSKEVIVVLSPVI